MKPAMETRKTFFNPKRSLNQPVSGVAMAAATINEVKTQVIWSDEAFRLPCICGRATLAMVPSMAWIMVASMIDMVIMVRLIGAPEGEGVSLTDRGGCTPGPHGARTMRRLVEEYSPR